jgi:soluble lytic murein transglycosylase-like protein
VKPGLHFRVAALTAASAIGFAVAVPQASADYAVLRSGQRLHITGFERTGSAVRLDLAGGSVTLPADELLSVEREDVFPSSAPEAQVSGPYAEEIRAASLAYALDPVLIQAVIAVESNFNAKAVSRKSARGLMQLLPGTAARLAVKNAFDPGQNIRAGAQYLREMLDRYDNDLPRALAAYNAGPENVDLYRGVPPFPETRNYVAQVMARVRTRQASASAESAGANGTSQ